MMSDNEKSKLYLIGLKYSEEKKKVQFKDGFDFVKTIYLASINLDIGNNIDSLNKYPKCRKDELETGDLVIYKSNDQILIGINYGNVLERIFMYYDEKEQEIKSEELYQNVNEYEFQYGIKLTRKDN